MNEIPVPRLPSFIPITSKRGEDPYEIPVRFATQARVRIEAPTLAIGRTYPEATSDQTRRSDDRQVLVLPLDDDVAELELDVRSAPFRNPLLAPVSELTFWSPLGWLLTALTRIVQ